MAHKVTWGLPQGNLLKVASLDAIWGRLKWPWPVNTKRWICKFTWILGSSDPPPLPCSYDHSYNSFLSFTHSMHGFFLLFSLLVCPSCACRLGNRFWFSFLRCFFRLVMFLLSCYVLGPRLLQVHHCFLLKLWNFNTLIDALDGQKYHFLSLLLVSGSQSKKN